MNSALKIRAQENLHRGNATRISDVLVLTDSDIPDALSLFPPESDDIIKKFGSFSESNPLYIDKISLYIANCVISADISDTKIKKTAAKVFESIATYRGFTVDIFKSDEFFVNLLNSIHEETTSGFANTVLYSLLLKFPSQSITFLDESTIRAYFEYFSNSYKIGDQFNHDVTTEFLNFFDCLAEVPEDLIPDSLEIFHEYIQSLINDEARLRFGLILAFKFYKYQLYFEIPEITENRELYVKYLLHLSSLDKYPLLITFDEFFEIFKKPASDNSMYFVLGKIMSSHAESFSDSQKQVLIEYFIENNESYGYLASNPILFGFYNFGMEYIIQHSQFIDLYLIHAFKQPNECSIQFVRVVLNAIMEAIKSSNIDFIDHAVLAIDEYQEYYDEFASISDEHSQLIEILLSLVQKLKNLLEKN